MAVSGTAANIYLPGLSTTLNNSALAGITQAFPSTYASNLASTVPTGGYIPMETRFYGSGTWTRPANTASTVRVVLVGGGGSGASPTTSYAGGGGGGAGQLLDRFVDISSVSIGSGISIAIGGGAGAPGANSNSQGNNGGNSTFGVNGQTFYLISWGGGGGGTQSNGGNNGNYGYCDPYYNTIYGSGSGGGGGGYYSYQYAPAGGGGGAGASLFAGRG